MKLTSLSVHDLLIAFRSAEPTPGGGSAAALAGAVGASLLAMVAGLPKPKATDEGDITELRAAGERCGRLAQRLESLIDQDTDAYDRVVSAFRMPKATDEEKAGRTAAIQEALMAATEAPLEVMRRCGEALEASGTIARFGNPNAASDAQVALEMLKAGLRGARENVEINLGSIKDAAYVERARNEAAVLAAKAR